MVNAEGEKQVGGGSRASQQHDWQVAGDFDGATEAGCPGWLAGSNLKSLEKCGDRVRAQVLRAFSVLLTEHGKTGRGGTIVVGVYYSHEVIVLVQCDDSGALTARPARFFFLLPEESDAEQPSDRSPEGLLAFGKLLFEMKQHLRFALSLTDAWQQRGNGVRECLHCGSVRHRDVLVNQRAGDLSPHGHGCPWRQALKACGMVEKVTGSAKAAPDAEESSEKAGSLDPVTVQLIADLRNHLLFLLTAYSPWQEGGAKDCRWLVCEHCGHATERSAKPVIPVGVHAHSTACPWRRAMEARG